MSQKEYSKLCYEYAKMIQNKRLGIYEQIEPAPTGDEILSAILMCLWHPYTANFVTNLKQIVEQEKSDLERAKVK